MLDSQYLTPNIWKNRLLALILQKDEAIRRRDEFIASDEVYTPEMILCREEVRNAVTNDFSGLIQRYIDEKGLEDRTIEKRLIWYNERGRDYLHRLSLPF